MTDLTSEEETGYFSDEAATFGDRVAAARRAAGLSQESLCRKLGIKLKTLRAWEDDLSEPRANKLQMLAGVLNVSLIWLLTGQGVGVAAPADGEGLDAGMDMIAISALAASDLLTEIAMVRADHAALGVRLSRLEQMMIVARQK